MNTPKHVTDTELDVLESGQWPRSGTAGTSGWTDHQGNWHSFCKSPAKRAHDQPKLYGADDVCLDCGAVSPEAHRYGCDA